MINNSLKSHLYLVTGKGGVGKSTVATALAESFAAKGERTLLVEVGEFSYFESLFRQKIQYEPTAVRDNLYVAKWDGESSLKEFVGHFLKIKKLVNLFFDNKVMGALIKAAPALREIAILGKLTSRVRGIGPKFEFDKIVLDAYATGHFVSLLKVPQGMSEAISFGPMGEQSREIDQVIKDPELTKIFIVTLPEELPVQECKELYAELKTNFQQKPQVVLNMYLDVPELLSQQEDDFVQYLQKKADNQAHAINELSGLEGEIQKVPWSFAANAIDRISEIKEHF